MVEKEIPYDHYYGATALSQDKTILYLFVNGDANGQVILKGVKTKVLIESPQVLRSSDH